LLEAEFLLRSPALEVRLGPRVYDLKSFSADLRINPSFGAKLPGRKTLSFTNAINLTEASNLLSEIPPEPLPK